MNAIEMSLSGFSGARGPADQPLRSAGFVLHVVPGVLQLAGTVL